MDPAMHNPRVSYDLLRPIFEHLEDDKAALCTISLSSSTFRDEAQRTLFRKVTTLDNYTAHVQFLRIVAASPNRLALFVHSYSHSWTIDSESPVIKDFMKEPPNIATVRDGLKAMSCLKELTIGLAYSLRDCNTTYIHILSTCTFRLERFRWLVQRNHNELVEKFLVYQPTLRRLVLSNRWFRDKLPVVPSTMCPLLVSMSADWGMIKAFLPGRNISILHSSDCDGADMNIKPLAAELKRVKFLSILFPALWRMKLSGVDNLQCLSPLNSLVILCIGHWDPDEYVMVQPKTPELVSILSELPALQTLTLTRHSQLRSPEEDTKLTQDLFAKFGEHLKCIDIGVSRHSYSRYIRSQETIQEISEEEARQQWL